MHDRCCDLCPLLSNRDSSGAKKRSMMGFQFFLAYFGLYIIFKVPMVEHGSDACPMEVLPYR